MQRTPLIAGNWKMHTTISEAVTLAKAVAEASQGLNDRQVMIAPPFTALAAVAKTVSGSGVQVAGQNVCWEEKGAFTGEIAPNMLKDAGCTMAIIGHSERRQIFGEPNEMINKRVLGAQAAGLIPILCIGETLAEREADKTFSILEEQIRKGLAEVAAINPARLVIAYEPVWAIGTGKTASKEQAQEVHCFLRKILADLYEKNIASQIRILYGGSVNSDNIDALMAQDDVDGALVGGAALKPESFSRIIRFQ